MLSSTNYTKNFTVNPCQYIRYKMKHQKKIIEHLIEYSKPATATFSKQDHSRQYRADLHEPTIQLETHLTYDKDQVDVSAELCPAYNFEVCVEIGDGRTDWIKMNENSDPFQEAHKFCIKYQLEEYIVDLLAESLTEQVKKQRTRLKGSIISSKQKSKRSQGAEKILSQNRMYRYTKNSQELWKQTEEEPTRQVKINEVSEEIIKKMGGKNKIIESMTKKFQQKAQQLLLDQIENEEQQFQKYSFHPSIDPISRKVDETLHCSRKQGYNVARYEHLYEQHRVIENKKEMKRRNSLMEIPFKPIINNVSRTIMAKKKSLGQIYPLSAGKQRPKSSQKYNNQPEKPRTKRRQSLNESSQLCYHLFEEAKKRKQKIQKETERIYGNQSNWKIIQSSNSLVFNLRENRIREIFDNLAKNPYHQLRYEDIDEKNLTAVERIFIPLFKEMKEIGTGLNREQFVEAGMRLLKYLSPNERAILIRKSSHAPAVNQKENKKFQPELNKKSRQIAEQKSYGQKDIYMRGLIFKSEVKTQIEKGKQQKVRNELKDCTFKPRINGNQPNQVY